MATHKGTYIPILNDLFILYIVDKDIHSPIHRNVTLITIIMRYSYQIIVTITEE